MIMLHVLNSCCCVIQTFIFEISVICTGEKMDTKHCETLEEVFRRVQFRLVDLEGTHLEEEVSSMLNLNMIVSLPDSQVNLAKEIPTSL